MSLVAVAALKRQVLVAAVRVKVFAVAIEAPGVGDHVVHVMATALGAELLAGHFSALGQLHAVGGHGIVVGDPLHGLAHLLGDHRLMAAQAVVARLGVRGHQHALVAAVVRVHVAVHGAMADGVAEAGRLVPHPETCTRHHDHRGHDAADDPAALGLALRGRRLRVLTGLGELLVFSHSFLSFSLRPSASPAGATTLEGYTCDRIAAAHQHLQPDGGRMLAEAMRCAVPHPPDLPRGPPRPLPTRTSCARIGAHA